LCAVETLLRSLQVLLDERESVRRAVDRQCLDRMWNAARCMHHVLPCQLEVI
jgi:hypothetical protein